MAGGTNDPHGYRNDYKKEKKRLKEAAKKGKIDEEDRAAIREWGNSLSGKEYSTRASRLCNIRKLAERSKIGGYGPLVDYERKATLFSLLDDLEEGTNPDVKDEGLSENSLRALRQTARLFFRDKLDREWAEDIDVGATDSSNISAEDVLRADDVDALFDAAKKARNKALIGFLLATGQRISATLSVRVGDIDLEGKTGFVYLNDDAIGLKGAGGKRPILWATEYVKNWLDVHPYADDPDAALFCSYQESGERRGKGEALAVNSVIDILKRIGERAGVEKDVNPHAFRHSAITRMAEEGLSEQQIKWMVGWSKDSTQFERYSHAEDEEMAASVLDELDIEQAETDVGKPTLDTCPSCGAALDEWINPQACPGCGISLSTAAVQVEQAMETVEEDAKEAALHDNLTEEERKAAQAIVKTVDDPSKLVDHLSRIMRKEE